MAPDQNDARAGLFGPARLVIRYWALAGGLILLALVLVNAVSVTGSALFGSPFPGDFELTEVGVAIAAFSFLPYCQITGANVTADIFTSGASKTWLAIFGLAGSIVALGFSLLLAWRMYYGMLDQRAYDSTTAILQIPTWWAYGACLLSLALLAVASFASLVDALHAMSRR